MRIFFLGTCSGTEPQKDRKHMSFAIECSDRIYWFDAGEGCSYTAHNMGIDLLKVEKIVISHPHMDHVGGLGNLLWNIRKLYNETDILPSAENIEVYIPNLETWEGLMMILRNTEGHFKIPFSITAHKTFDGVLFDDGVMKVTAYHNTHLKPINGEWQSYSFVIECENKKIVYSGDLGNYPDLDEVLKDGCDGLIAETGHFSMDYVCEYLNGRKFDVNKVYFSHNGWDIMRDQKESAERVVRLFGDGAVICYDGMTVEL